MPTGDIAITPYADMYIIVKYGSLSVKVRAKRGGTYPIVCPVSALNDTEIYLYASSNIVEISSIAGLYCQYIDLGNAYRLRKFVAGSDANGYSNLNLAAIGLGNNTMLEHLDLNGASMKYKGYDFAVRRLTHHLHRHYRKHGNNGYILLYDFSKFFDNVSHAVVKQALRKELTDEKLISKSWYGVQTKMTE